MAGIGIRPSTLEDVPLIFQFMGEQTEGERLSHCGTGSEDPLRSTVFGVRAVAEVVIARADDTAVGFAVFFANFSTFLGRPGLYLEDLFVRPQARRLGIGRALLEYLARLTI